MKHGWRTHKIDGGPLGIGTFWKCRRCGAGGGPALLAEKPVRAFIPGPATRLPLDCEAARKEIHEFVQAQIALLRKKWPARGPKEYWIAGLIHDAIRWTPQATDLTPIVSLTRDILHPIGKPRGFMDVREELERAGFCVMPQVLGSIIKQMGEASLKRRRRHG